MCKTVETKEEGSRRSEYSKCYLTTHSHTLHNSLWGKIHSNGGKGCIFGTNEGTQCLSYKIVDGTQGDVLPYDDILYKENA